MAGGPAADETVIDRAESFGLGAATTIDSIIVRWPSGNVWDTTGVAVDQRLTLIERFQSRRIVFTGVAGGLGEDVRVGDVVVARALLQHDMDASPLFPRHEVPLTGHSHFATDAALSDALVEAARGSLADVQAWLGDTEALAGLGIVAPRVHEGLVISGDRFVCEAAESLALRAELPAALAVEMEGAAVAQVCHDLDVPFAVLRTISDRADDSAHVDFQRFVHEVASRYSAAVVRRWLHTLGG